MFLFMCDEATGVDERWMSSRAQIVTRVLESMKLHWHSVSLCVSWLRVSYINTQKLQFLDFDRFHVHPSPSLGLGYSPFP